MPIRLLALIFFCGLGGVLAQAPQPTPTPSVVYYARDPAAIVQYRPNAATIRRMVDRVVLAAMGQNTIAAAWRSLVSPQDKVGIKVCAAGGELFSTHVDVVDAIVDGLAAAGVPRDNIIVWDRQLSDIKAAGYREGRYRLLSIEPRVGYDGTAVLTAPLLGKLIWGDLRYVPHYGANPTSTESENTSNESHFAKILTQQVTKVINVPVMSNNELTGMAGCIYNMTLPNIDNWRRFTQYGAVSAGPMAQIYGEPVIAKKIVLNIMDGLIASYADGPEAHPNYAVHEAKIFASRDPVAIDTLALARLEQLRVGARLPPIGSLAAHVQMAGALGLGQADARFIVLKDVGR